jgi:DNA-binding transcriptional LysR family regulator
VRLEIRHLEVLLAVAECGSISGAARKLGVDQPHISRQLRRIEQRLSTTVFVRSARGVTLTPPGMRVVALARRALGVLDELACPAGRGAGLDVLRVLYHGLPAIAILDGLGAAYPGLQAQLRTTTPAGAFAELRAGRAEVFLGVWLPHVAWPAAEPVAAVNVLTDPTYVHLAADHPLAAQPELRLADLADEPWIAGTDDDSCTMVTQECRLVGGFEPR